MNIIISGPQGSGKGTQGKLLAERKNFFHLENGKLLRKLGEHDNRIRNMLNLGVLVPNQETLEIMHNHLVENNIGFDNIIFDGFPRSLAQYEDFKKWLTKNGSRVNYAVVLDIKEQTTIQRLSSRRVNKTTGETYNLITKPPIGVPEDEIIQREDDLPDSIRNRLKIYNEETKPLIEQYKKDGILVSIDGEQSIEDIYSEIVAKLGL